jgi:hypothetical protein
MYLDDFRIQLTKKIRCYNGLTLSTKTDGPIIICRGYIQRWIVD